MATLASLIATQQATVDGEAAALKTAIENICVLGVLTGHRIGSIADLETYIRAAVGENLAVFFTAQRKAGDTVREAATTE